MIGNTGNARTTPPHLHLGIYAAGGAIDPLPFVNPSVKNPAEPDAAINLKEGKMRLTKTLTLKETNFATSYPTNTIVDPIAATAKTYRVILPNGFTSEIEKSALQSAQKPMQQVVLKSETYLLNEPQQGVPRIKLITANTTITVLGLFESFQYVKVGNIEGWLPTATLQ